MPCHSPYLRPGPHLDVDALQQLDTERDPNRIAAAIVPILDYLEARNPAFFAYRFGHSQGQAMEAGLRERHELALRAADQGHLIAITPVRRYRLPGRGQEVVESSPQGAHEW